ncbi:MAG: heme exporter protein CcmB [Asticcacaulis sp.]
MSPALALLSRELDLVFGRGGGPLLACGFYAALTALTPMAAGPSEARLLLVAPGLAWLTLSLASLLSLDQMFARDYDDGSLDHLALSPLPLALSGAIKCVAQWLAIGLPLALCAPVGAIILGAPVHLAPMILLTALIGGLAMAFIGGMGASLTLGARRGGILIALIVLPLFAPPVIFGTGAVEAVAGGLNPIPALGFLGAFTLTSLALCPLAMALTIRNALS